MMPMPEPRDVDSAGSEQLHHQPRLAVPRSLPAPLAADDENSVDLRRVFSALQYHWFLFVVVGSLLGAAFGAAAWELLPAKYTTTALLRVNSSNAGLLGNDSTTVRSEFLTFLRTQSDAIRSENVLRAALRDSKIGATETLRSIDDPVRWLQENIVVEFSENSELMKVSMTGENAAELAEIINAINAAYMKEVVLVDQLKKKSVLDQLDRSRQAVEEKVRNLKVTLDLKRKKPASSTDAGAVPPGDQEPLKLRVGSADFARMNDEYRRSEVGVKLADQRIQTVQAKRDKVDAQEIPAEELDDFFKRDPEFKDLTDRAERLEKQFNFLKNTYSSPTHPDVVHAKQQSAAARVAADDYRRTKKTELVRGVQTHNRKIIDVEMEKAMTDLAAKTMVRQMLRRQIETVGVLKDTASSSGLAIKDKSPADYDTDDAGLISVISTFEDLLKQQNNQSVETQASKPRVDVWQAASVPIKKEMKKQIMFTGFAALFGFVAVGACVTLYESRINRLFGSQELTRNASLNVIGILPEIAAGDAISSSSDAARLKADPFMEGVEKVRLMLSRHFHGRRAQTILISSAGPGEGKTTLAGHLALSLTRADRKTIIVDANLRRPGLHEHLGLPAGAGICELLRGECATTEVIQRSSVNNLWFLGAGVWDSVAQQALGRDRFRRIIDKLRQEFDHVIVDSHDLSTVADTYLMGQHCDAVIVCARKFVSRRPMVEQAYQKVCELGVAHAGVIFMGESAK